MSTSSTTPKAPRVIDGRYRLLMPLGEGGMSIVYQAEHVFTGRRVAVKLLWPRLADNPDAVRHFLKEARSAARIIHPYCVNILDMGQEPDGTLYLVQELLTGMDLRCHLQTVRRLPLKEALAIALPILETLAAAHTQGVIHRDVKPANIFLCTTPGTEGMVPKLIDFGIAKVAELDLAGSSSHGQTQTGLAIGTPAYMAPEQLRGDKNLDGRADLWSMAVVLYEMLAGKRPFAADNVHMITMKILCERAPPLDAQVEGIPAGMVAAMARALEPDRTERWPSIEEFRAALVQGSEETPLVAVASTPPVAIAVVKPEVPAEAPVLPSSTSPPCEPPAETSRLPAFEPFEEEMSELVNEARSSHRRLHVVLGLALGLAAFGVWFWWSTRDTPDANTPGRMPSTSVQASPAPHPAVPPPAPPPALPQTVQEPMRESPARVRTRRRRPTGTPVAPLVPTPRPDVVETPLVRTPRGTNDAPILE